MKRREARDEGVSRSGIALAPTGISGLDNLLGGGLPRQRSTVIVGAPGSGKTLLALETLVHGARTLGQPGLFVAFEESTSSIVANAQSFGWDLPALQRRKLAFFDARLPSAVITSGKFDLLGLIASVEARARALGAKRIVFDGIDMLLSVLDDPVAERREIFRIAEWLSSFAATGIFTCKSSPEGVFAATRDGYMQYLADCVIVLEKRIQGAAQVRRLRITKSRGIGCPGNEIPMAITERGIHVASYPALPHGKPVTAKIPTGIARLDAMLRGGFYRGSSVIVSGAPGTAKSTLAGAFAAACCTRGDRVLYASFDEAPHEILRNMASVGLALEPHVRAGCLNLLFTRKRESSAEEQLVSILRTIEDERPQVVIVDPISAFLHGGGGEVATEVGGRLIALAKARGITLFGASLLSDANGDVERTATGLSTLADTWIHLSYVVRAGERNRALTLIKSRGVGHSNQVRELVLSDAGITLTDVYAEDGEVLMGTMRWQKEQSERQRRVHAEQRADRDRRAAELEIEETRARLRLLEQQLAVKQASLDLLRRDRTDHVATEHRRAASLRQLRGDDGERTRNGRSGGADQKGGN